MFLITKQFENLKPEFISYVTSDGYFYKNCVPLIILKSGLVMRDVVIRALLTQTLQNQSKERKLLSYLYHLHG